MNAKPWQIGVIVVGLLVATGLTVWNLMGSDDALPSTYLVIDVESGQIYRVNKDRYRLSLPAPHPQTKKRSLIGVQKDDQGYFVSDYNLAALNALDEGVKNNAVDPKTGDLIGTVKEPVSYDPD